MKLDQLRANAMNARQAADTAEANTARTRRERQAWVNLAVAVEDYQGEFNVALDVTATPPSTKASE